jgi:hypothetical protein
VFVFFYLYKKFYQEGITAMGKPTSIEKLDYAYKHIDSGYGDKDTALRYLQDVAMELDAQVLNDTCGGGKTIPSHKINV